MIKTIDGWRMLLLAGLLTLGGCALMPGGDGWRESAVRSLKAPAVWVPAVAAVAVHGADREISDSATRGTKVFGTTDDAEHFSDQGRDALFGFALLSSAVRVADDDEPAQQLQRQALALSFSAAGSLGTTVWLKDSVQRARPTGDGDDSFPSGHTAAAFLYAGHASSNFREIEWLDDQQWAVDTLLYGSAAGVAWARIEAGKHFPSDVLAGAALSNYFTRWARYLWLKEDNDPGQFAIVPGDSGAVLYWYRPF